MSVLIRTFFRLDDHRYHVPWHGPRITVAGNLEPGAATFSFPFEMEAGRNDLSRIFQGVALQVHDHRFQGLSFDTNHCCQDRLLHVDRSARGQKSDSFVGDGIVSFAISQTLTHRAGHPPPAGPMQTPHSPPKFGDPLPGLTTQQATNFTLGQAQFRVTDGPANGLGPIFNAQSCNACHTQPYANGIATTGGASAITETRAGMLNPDGSFYPLTTEDGTLLSGNKAVARYCRMF